LRGGIRARIAVCQNPWHNGDVVANIDKFGRVVIPKAMRDALRLSPGMEVELFLDKGAIAIRPRQVQSPMRRAEDGKLVLQGELRR